MIIVVALFRTGPNSSDLMSHHRPQPFFPILDQTYALNQDRDRTVRGQSVTKAATLISPPSGLGLVSGRLT